VLFLNKRRQILKSYNPDYCRTKLKQLAKDYIGGDLSDPELSPLISDDPILQQQCRTRGYMTIPIGGELRNVICGGTNDHEGDELKVALLCPICHNVYCKRHLTEHLDEPIYTTPRGREIRVDNPEIYIGMPDADLRTEMSSWSNEELNRNHEELDRAFDKVDNIVSSIPEMDDVCTSLTIADEFPGRWIQVKSMEEGGAGSGHYGHQGVPGSRGGSQPSGRVTRAKYIVHGIDEDNPKATDVLSANTKMYHITPAENVKSILRNGIRQSPANDETGNPSGTYIGDSPFPVGSADSPSGQYAAFEIDLPDNVRQNLWQDTGGGYVVTNTSIKPEWLKSITYYHDGGGDSGLVPFKTVNLGD